MLATLVRLAGPDRVMLGSDYPFDMGDPQPLGIVDVAVTDAAAREAICGGTAKAFFGLTV